MESIGGTRAGSERLSVRSERRRGGFLWTPAGDPRSRCGTALSVSPKAARRLDAGQFVEIEIDNRLQGLAGGAVAQRLGQRDEPGGILGLEPQECGDGGMPLLRSTGMADRLRRAPRRRRAVVVLALAVAGLPLGPGERTLSLWFAASAWHLSAGRRRV